MKLISWNVNGLRSIDKKGDLDAFIASEDPDIIGLQEIRCDDQCAATLLKKHKDRYPYIYYNTSKARKGYAGTAVLSKIKPTNVLYDIPESFEPGSANHEGRVIVCLFPAFVFLTVYTPNSGGELKRHTYRTDTWDHAFKAYIKTLGNKVIVCGDLNVAKESIDIYNAKGNQKSAGFTTEERNSFSSILSDCELEDTFRALHPQTVQYTYWSNFNNSRTNNRGWRIDYFLVKNVPYVKADVYDKVMGSDHAPVMLELSY